ncbi:MAG: hypothetical protein FWF46_00450 [Oscillospiraceae bacterium]|nr:hypothetical protein [Oscillospiraceae bacterium]
MNNYEFVVINQTLTNAKNEDELITIFNEKLATLFLFYEKITIEGCK